MEKGVLNTLILSYTQLQEIAREEEQALLGAQTALLTSMKELLLGLLGVRWASFSKSTLE